jgi:hypothetical protein
LVGNGQCVVFPSGNREFFWVGASRCLLGILEEIMARVRTFISAAFFGVAVVVLVGSGVAAGASGNAPAAFVSDDGDEWIG